MHHLLKCDFENYPKFCDFVASFSVILLYFVIVFILCVISNCCNFLLLVYDRSY